MLQVEWLARSAGFEVVDQMHRHMHIWEYCCIRMHPSHFQLPAEAKAENIEEV